MKELRAKLERWQEELLFSEVLPRMGAAEHSVPHPERISLGDDHATIAEVQLDETTVALVGLFHDRVPDILENGLDSMMQHLLALQHGFVNRIKELAEEHDSVFGCLVVGGLGRSWGFPVPTLPARASLTAIHLADLETLASVEEASLLRFMKLVQHEEWLHSQGVTIVNLSGPLNLFAFWESNGYSLIPDYLYLPETNGRLLIPSDSLRDLRVRARVNRDRHGVRAPDVDGQFVAVERLTPHGFFPSQARRPIYAAPHALTARHLAGIVEGQSLRIWVLTSGRGLPAILRHQAYGIWAALLQWLDRARGLLPTAKAEMLTAVVRIHMEEPSEWARQLSEGITLAPAKPRVAAGPSEIAVRISPGFLALLDRTENDGERSLLVAVVSALFTRIKRTPEVESTRLAQQVVEGVMQDRDAREIHMFRSRGPTDHLPNRPGPVPRLIQPEDVSVARVGLAWKCLERQREGRIVEGDSAQTLLHCCVDALWLLIRERLSKLDRLSIIGLAMRNLEAIHHERQQWRLTARAVLALNETREETLRIAADREGERTVAAVSFRVLIEMAAASGNRGKGNPARWAELDHLSAHVSALLGLASHSDAIRGHLAEPVVGVTEAGRLQFDREYIGELLRPFSRRRLDREYLEYASNYEDYRDPGGGNNGSSRFTEDFASAFKEEFGVSIEGLLETVGALLDLAADEERLVVRRSATTLQRRVRRARGLARSDVANALSFLTLPSRDRWDSTPKGYSDKDWYPWRFRRRLSIALAPLVALGQRPEDDIVFGASQLPASVSYRLNGLGKGYFPSEHFATGAMQRYVGDTRRRQGHDFALRVADVLGTIDWHTDTNVEMSSLGAPAELGDIDVLAWRRDTRRLLVIECKSLIPRGNTYELVEELLAFRGEAKDRLGRHLARVEWLSDNTRVLSRCHTRAGQPPQLTPLFVTNRDVPMRYVDTLPVPPEGFQTIDELRESMADG
ncbi:hypothetical protein [Candidatus Palauibacter sp.]|uniref:hypothetical protein n=1 Tax=Candidatus Palauibacter sp. TaxID=3101350 RepID=UPI003B51AC9B